MAVAGDGVGVSQRVADATISMWEKTVSEDTINYFPLLALLKAKGAIKHMSGGGEIRWVPRVKDHDLQGYVDGGPKAFQKVRTTRNAYLPIRGYELTDACTLMEQLQNQGEAAQIKLIGQKLNFMYEAGRRQLAKKFWQDGNASGNEEDFHGFESFCSINTGSQTASDRLATVLNDTYASLSTSYTGINSQAAAGDDDYGVWSPRIVNTNINPGGGARSWEDYADEFVRTGILESSYGTAPEDNLDLILCHKTAYEQLLNILDDKEQLNLRRGEDVMMRAKFGFKNFVELDGVAIGWDHSLAGFRTDANSDTVHAYGFNTSKLALYLLSKGGKKSLFMSRVEWNQDYQAERVWLGILGNLRFRNPRYFCKWADIA